jgi:signal transduction histidine kinase
MNAAAPGVRPRRGWGPAARDAAIALLAFALTLLLLGHFHGASSRGLDGLGILLAALASFPLLERRRAPLAAFALTTAASAVLNGLNYALGPPYGPTFALFFVATDDRTRKRPLLTGAVIVGMFVVHVGATMIAHHGFPTSPLLFGIVVWGGAWLIGDQIRQRRERLAGLHERARQAERETARERRLAAAEERTRIARDLHDSAAHAINVILVQAGAARLLQETDPAAVTTALTTIEEVARETIGEIDNLVHGLREEDGAEPAIEPPTGLAALDTLAARYRAASLETAIEMRGERRPLPRRLDQAAYRIIQESLTNAARHGSGEAHIVVNFGPTELELTVTNPARPLADGDGKANGHGILGMRERAALLGGALETSHRYGHFEVHGRLPYTGPATRA